MRGPAPRRGGRLERVRDLGADRHEEEAEEAHAAVALAVQLKV